MKKRAIPTPSRIRAFRKKIYAYYRANAREFPWRRTRDPYCVLVSEVMLQQTQAGRVREKYPRFIAAFPDFPSLALAPLAKLLRVWQGLGYNRRALALRALARRVADVHGGTLPSTREELIDLPGIGAYTAGAVLAFAFNEPVVFMDTNIRRVFIHEFFPDRSRVRDAELLPLVQETVDRNNARTWYNALMDYGAMLKTEHANPNRRSAHYARQRPFADSDRRARGLILKALVNEAPMATGRIVKVTGLYLVRVKKILPRLEREGFIRKKGRVFRI